MIAGTMPEPDDWARRGGDWAILPAGDQSPWGEQSLGELPPPVSQPRAPEASRPRQQEEMSLGAGLEEDGAISCVTKRKTARPHKVGGRGWASLRVP